MISTCGFCGGMIDTEYGNYQMSPDFPGQRFCWALAGGRDNCLEKMKDEAKESGECEEGLHMEYKGDICPNCGQEIKTDWMGGN